jgi:DNA-binding NarL/FixJ family response regulator
MGFKLGRRGNLKLMPPSSSPRPAYSVGKYPRAASTKIAGVIISRREKQLLNLQSAGITLESKQAAELDLKTSTINNYWAELFQKLRACGFEVHSKQEAEEWARSTRGVPQKPGPYQRNSYNRRKRKSRATRIR